MTSRISTSAEQLFDALARSLDNMASIDRGEHWGLSERLHNGGQIDLYEMAMAQERTLRMILAAMEFEGICPETFNFGKCCDLIHKTLEKTT